MSETNDWYSADAATLGDRLVAAREAASLSQSALARLIGVRLPTLRGWEEDRTEPRANKLAMVCGVLNISIPWLLSGEGHGVEEPSFMQADENPEPLVRAIQEIRTLKAQLLDANRRVQLIEKQLQKLHSGPVMPQQPSIDAGENQ